MRLSDFKVGDIYVSDSRGSINITTITAIKKKSITTDRFYGTRTMGGWQKEFIYTWETTKGLNEVKEHFNRAFLLEVYNTVESKWHKLAFEMLFPIGDINVTDKFLFDAETRI